MARQLSDPHLWPGSRELVAHGGHVHVGSSTFGVRELDEARSIVDEGDGTNQDLHQLLQQDALPTRLPRSMVGSTAALVVVSLALTVAAGPVFGYAGRAAGDVLDRSVYRSAVLPGGIR
jgi:multicomponent Na+:H+ antiporter subunit D